MFLVWRQAISFVAETDIITILLPDDYKGKCVILFSHPADFTQSVQGNL